MRDPLRLREEGGTALERALLDAGASYQSSSAARAKTLAALGVAGSATLVAGAAQAAPLGTLAKLGWTKLLAAVSIVGAAAAVPGYYAWQHHEAARHASAQKVAVAVAARPPEADELPPAMQVRNVGEQVQATTPGPIHFVPAAPVVGDAETHSVRTSPRPTVTLAHELSTLDAARGMLARGDAGGALERLDAYTHRYPHGRLALEAEVLRIDALEQSGRADAAHARAEAFLQRHPHSVLAARVRARLAD
jgi:hypothetical protein